MKNNWKETTLENAIDLIIDHRGLTPKKLGGDWSKKGYRAISAKTIKDGRIVNEDQMNILSEDLYKKWMKEEVQYGDIFLTSEAPLGEHIIWKSNEKLVLSQRIFGIRTKKKILDPFYFNYFIDSKYYQHELRSRESGSTVTGIKQSELLKTNIILPPLPEQKAIAGVLGSLDDKIELLREQNKTLETTTQTIFKEWFVHSNEGDLGNLQLWRLEELVDVFGGYSYKGSELREKSDYGLVTLKCFDRNGGFQIRGFKPFDGKPKDSQEVVIGDLIVAHTDLTQSADVLGNPAFIFDNGGFEKMYITMDLMKINSKKKEINNAFLYFLMKTHAFKKHCIGFSNGTTVLHLSRKAVPSFEVRLSNNLQKEEKFSLFANEIMNKIILNNSQIQTLSKTRDALLPKLMSREVEV